MLCFYNLCYYILENSWVMIQRNSSDFFSLVVNVQNCHPHIKCTVHVHVYPCSLIILLWYTRCSATSCQAQAYSHPVLITYICLSKILIAVSPIFVRFIPLLYCYVVSLTWASVDDDEWFLPLFLPVICCVSNNEIVVTHHRIWNRGQTAS